jgi:hypothetical protein
MSQKEIEIILARQLAEYLTTPLFIVDAQGAMVYYNEPSERLLGMRFDHTGEIPAAEWSAMFKQVDAAGNPIAAESLPLMVALTERRPAHCDMWIRGLDGVARHIQVTAIPLMGHAGRFLGAAAILWEVPPP